MPHKPRPESFAQNMVALSAFALCVLALYASHAAGAFAPPAAAPPPAAEVAPAPAAAQSGAEVAAAPHRPQTDAGGAGQPGDDRAARAPSFAPVTYKFAPTADARAEDPRALSRGRGVRRPEKR